jgi:hypothetical protein
MTTTTTDDFTRGVNWGKFVASVFEDDPETESARTAVLDAVLRHLADRPDPALMETMSNAWFDYHCHGNLKAGEVCSKCGAINPGDD